MKKFAVLFMATTCFFLPSLTGCGGGSGETTVIEAPPAGEEEEAMEGMSDDDYDAAMDAEMSGE
jgi:hypothetical protein